MLENEGNVSGSVQKRNDLDKIAQSIISQFLKLGWAQCVRLNDSWGTWVLKMPLQFDRKSVDFEECCLSDSSLQYVQMLKVVSVVPIDFAKLKIRPVHNLTFRQPETPAPRLDQLHKSLDSVEKPRRRIGSDANLLS